MEKNDHAELIAETRETRAQLVALCNQIERLTALFERLYALMEREAAREETRRAFGR